MKSTEKGSNSYQTTTTNGIRLTATIPVIEGYWRKKAMMVRSAFGTRGTAAPIPLVVVAIAVMKEKIERPIIQNQKQVNAINKNIPKTGASTWKNPLKNDSMFMITIGLA